jgi:uncharacterized protein (TIGR02118 family)
VPDPDVKEGQMIKMVYCVKRRDDVSEEEFFRYWLEDHGALLRKHGATMRLKRYVQSHFVPAPLNEMIRQLRGMGEPYDGLAELWFESLDDFIDAMSSDEGMEVDAAMREDEAKFIDMAGSCIFFSEEHVIYESD